MYNTVNFTFYDPHRTGGEFALGKNHRSKCLLRSGVTLSAVFLLSFLATAFLSHSLTPAFNSSAEDTVYSDFTTNPVLSFAITDPNNSDTALSSIDLSTSPNTFVSRTVNLLASTGNETGYTLSFSDDDEDTALYLDGDNTSEFFIPTLAANTSDLTDINNNTWGYAFADATVFSPVPAASTPVRLNQTATANSLDSSTASGFADNKLTFTIGAKADMGKASGVYTDTLVFTMVGNPAPRVYLQDLTTEQCKSLELEKQYLYYDRRDDKAYTIARLADNNCWMTSNLRLGNEEGGAAIMLTSQDTNLAPGTTFELPASAGGVWATGDGAGSYKDAATVNTKHMYSGGQKWFSGDFPYNITTQEASGAPSTPARYTGNYYNWYTATAGNGLFNNTTTNTTYDICPKGWRLPSGNSSGEWQHLVDQYSDTGNLNTKAQIVYAGAYDFYTGAIGWLPTLAHYWTSTPSQDAIYTQTHYAFIDGTAHIDIDNTKTYGFSVRCIYQPTIEGLDSEISYMQDMTDEICKATPTPLATDNVVPQATLIDMRGKDGSGTVANPVNDKTSSNYQSYIVRKLADGNCWMVQNLNMTLSTSITLTSDTTDIGYGYSQNALGTGHNATNTSTTSGRTSWTPNNSTQTVEGAIWEGDGSDGARSFEPGEDVYFAEGLGTGAYDTELYSYSDYNATGDSWYHAGNYYNWYASTAGTGTATMGSNGYEELASDSICPKNWQLPKNYGNKSWMNLIKNTYGFNIISESEAMAPAEIRAQPFNTVFAGAYGWHIGKMWHFGHGGVYMSSTVPLPPHASYSNMYTFNHGNLDTQSNAQAKGHGVSIRCVHRAGDITDLDFLQDISTQLCDATAIGVATELVDKRDGKNYSIKKLADGKCWMTANLQLGSGTALTLTPALSDVSVNFSLPVAPTTISRWGSSDSYAASTLQLYDSQNDDYGVYYNWYTATAETGTYTMTSGTANSSICPRGWKLPISDTSSNDFLDLYNAYSDISDFMSEGNWGVLSGYYHNAGAINEIGDRGYWLSSTPFTTSQGVFLLSTTALDVSPRYSFGRHFGYPVRCLVK